MALFGAHFPPFNILDFVKIISKRHEFLRFWDALYPALGVESHIEDWAGALPINFWIFIFVLL